MTASPTITAVDHRTCPVMLGRTVWLTTVGAACLLSVPAMAETRTTVEVSAGAIAASNPFLVNVTDPEAIGVSLTIDPQVFFEDDRSNVTLNGSFRLEQFTEAYGTGVSVDLGASGAYLVDERTTLRSDVGFRTSDSAARRFYGGVDLEGLEPGEFPDSPLLDPTLGNIAGRTSDLDANASIERALGPNSALTASTGLSLTRVEGDSGSDYNDASFGVHYTRQTTVRTAVQATLDAGYVDYLGQEFGDGVFVTGLAGVDHQFTRSLHVSAQLGASFVETQSLTGGRRTKLSWAGQFDLCNTYPRGTLCATASRSAQPTSLGGLTNVTSVGASYAHSFGTTATASVDARYARTSRGQLTGPAFSSGASELVSVSATYRHRIGERFSAFVTPSFTSVEDDLFNRRENYQAMLGISYRFGRT